MKCALIQIYTRLLQFGLFLTNKKIAVRLFVTLTRQTGAQVSPLFQETDFETFHPASLARWRAFVAQGVAQEQEELAATAESSISGGRGHEGGRPRLRSRSKARMDTLRARLRELQARGASGRGGWGSASDVFGVRGGNSTGTLAPHEAFYSMQRGRGDEDLLPSEVVALQRLGRNVSKIVKKVVSKA